MPAVQLSPAERDALEKWAGRRKTAQGLAVRARILLRADEGASNKAMAADLSLDPATVSKWRNRFLSDRVEGLYDRPRSGAPRRIDDAQVEALVLDTPSPPRADRQRPSRRG
ncbi:helix-turn-helix domain-containing protein [Methylobacterium aquaticum]|uniref:helix-turn-helix domain-containing protein n=1 Tax=Methylobacterium aquaticum TaxID=270351 RepID=UPI003D17CC34